MNKAFSILLLLALAASALAQGSKPSGKRSRPGKSAKQTNSLVSGVKEPAPTPEPGTVDPEADRKSFEAAVAAPTNAEKARLLRAFLDRFPESELREEAYTYLVTARAVVGNELVQAGDLSAGLASFKLAVEEAPSPIPERLFNDVILKIPGNLFYGKHRPTGIEFAQFIEKKVADSPKHLLGVAAFYLSIENGSEAKRVAEAALAVDPNSTAAYQALGLANRLNFDLEEAAKAYAKAVELDPASAPARRSLAEMNRALGKADAATAIYREILALNESDPAARQGLVLALFDAGHQKEAEAELGKLLTDEPRNFSLLTSVAYWYAANEQGGKAVEYAQKAVEIEPRYIWGHIVLARGLMKQNKPVDAERALLRARQYGNFPTLDYELASARFQAGLFREAVDELRKSFAIKDGLIGTRLGGRVFKEEKSFPDLLAYERRASLLQPLPADNADTSHKLRLLFELASKAETASDETELVALTDEFVRGTDKMKLHRQLYAANLLLQKNVGLAKAAELVKASVGNVDAGLDVPAPGAATMASELYESRSIAFARNEVVVIPEVPRQTLSAILRGRIEELAGWTLYQQKNYPEAIVRLKRAITVLPDKSAWWRSSMWRLGSALEADGKEKEALDSYIKSYVTDRPSGVRYGVIEALYRKVNGGTDGLEERIGQNPLTASFPPAPPVEQPKAAETAASNAPRVEPPAETAPAPVERTSRFPRHVPAQTPAAVAETGNPPTAVKPESEPEKAANMEATANSPAETVSGSKETPIEPAPSKANAASSAPDRAANLDQSIQPVVESVPAAPKDQPKIDAATPETADPPAEVKAKPAPDRTDAPLDSEVKIPSEPPAVKAGSSERDPDPTAAEKNIDPPKAPEVMEVKNQEPKADPAPQTAAKEEVRPARANENAAANNVEPIPTSAPARSVNDARENAPPEAEPEKEAVPGPDERKAEPPSIAPAEVKESQPKTSPPAETPANPDRAKTEPVNLMRDPFSGADPAPVKPPERKPLVIVNDPFKTGEKPAKPKTLFEPVIITVPGGKSKADPGPPQEKAPEAAPVAPLRTARQRVIEGKEILSDQRCSIDVSQNSIMLLSGGGSIGLRVRIDGEGDVADISASSASPQDIEVRPEPAIDGVTGRRFYVVKSISERTGIFQVNFESPCGKREVAVHVR